MYSRFIEAQSTLRPTLNDYREKLLRRTNQDFYIMCVFC